LVAAVDDCRVEDVTAAAAIAIAGCDPSRAFRARTPPKHGVPGLPHGKEPIKSVDARLPMRD
jgi:hypothetical protein